MSRATPPPDLSFSITHTHLARFLKISDERLSQLTEGGIIRRGVDETGAAVISKYRFDVAVSDYVEYQRQQIRGVGMTLEAERTKMAAVKRQIAETHLAKPQRTLIDANEPLELFRATCMRFRSKLVSGVSRLVRSVYQAGSIEEVHTRSETFLDEVLGELSRLRTSDIAKQPAFAVVDSEDGHATEGEEA